MSVPLKVVRPVLGRNQDVFQGNSVCGPRTGGRIRRTGGLDPHRFNVDFCCGHLVQGDYQDDKALHISVRFDQGAVWPFAKNDRDVVLNSLINNTWGMEHRCHNSFEAGKQFTLRILALRDYFKLTLNGKFLCDYVHRFPLERIMCIYIDGTVNIEEIEYQGAPEPSSLRAFAGSEVSGRTVWTKPEMPCTVNLTGFIPPKRLDLTGTPRMNGTRFEVDFMVNTEFLLHFRVDLPCHDTPDGAIVRNSTKNAEWVEEERTTTRNPFKPGHTFDMSFIARLDSAEIVVDGMLLVLFKYRPNLQPACCNQVQVKGDLILQRLELFDS